jgi:hypothetical protein
MKIPEYAYTGLYLSYFIPSVALVFDLTKKKIPSLLTWSFIACGLGLSLAYGGWNQNHYGLSDFLRGSATPCLYQSFTAIAFVCLLFGPATWKKALGSGDFLLLLGLASVSSLGPFLHLLIYIALSGFAIGLMVLLYKKLLPQAFRAIWSRLLFKGRLRNEQGQLLPIHSLKIPYSPAVVLGVFLSGAGWGWS